MTWQTVKIASVVMPIQRWNPARTAPDEELEYIDLSSVDKDSKTITGTTTYIGSEAPSRAQQLVRTGDILVSTVRPNLNGVACVSQEFDGSTASTGYCVLRPDISHIDPRYLFQWVKNQSFIDEMVRKATGANYPAVSDGAIKGSEIPLPSLPVQRRIAAVLDEVYALRQKREQSIDNLQLLLDATFREWVGDPLSGKYKFPTIRGRKVYKLASGKFFRREEHSANGKIPAYGGSGITGWADEPNFIGETIVIGRVGFHCGNVQLIKSPTYITDNAIYIRDMSKDFDIDYLFHFMRLAKLNRFRDPGDLKKITQKPLDELEVPAPGVEIQREISQAIKRIDDAIARAKASQDHIVNLLSSCQTRAFSGDLALRDFEAAL